MWTLSTIDRRIERTLTAECGDGLRQSLTERHARFPAQFEARAIDSKIRSPQVAGPARPTMRLDLNSADTGITSLAGEALEGGFTGQAFTLDTVSPRLAISSDLAQLKDGETATITFAFSEDPGATFTDSDIVVVGGILISLYLPIFTLGSNIH